MNKNINQAVSGNGDCQLTNRPALLHPSWLAFIRHCRELGYGEIQQLKIQDGLPVMAEESVRKTKFI